MPFSRLDPGMATAVDWAVHREGILEERNQNWPELAGNQVYLDLAVDGKTEQTMRLVFALFMDEVPLAAANFHALCCQRFDGLGDAGKPLSYRRSPISRINKGAWIQGGDITGSGGDSIYGKGGFEDEPLGLRMQHNAPGLLTMANDGPNSNASEFMITLAAAPQLDGSHVVFGRLLSGAAHLPTLEALPVDTQDRPLRRITVTDCGAVAGWQRLPLPLPDASEKPATLDGLSSQADAKRDAVAQAVAEAVAEAVALGSKKRAAEGEGAPDAKRAAAPKGMMALPGGLDDDDDDDDDDDE